MEIRVLNENDAETCHELRLQSLLDSPEAYLTTYEIQAARPIEEIREQLRPEDGRFTLGAFYNNKLAGMVTFVREYKPKIFHKGNIYAMYVAPEARGLGIGKQLIKELVRKASRLEGLEQINLTVISDNTAAKALYAGCGFEVFGIERNAMKSGDQYWDEEDMVLRLK
ncbi:GNAT family N-acetyltransferase [Paenibacillus glycanilyticus]|uniref:GNAT family N-acetyltransferase n=1 Tax=Paenibacillus glycanilyticus TaxID=126569 RepID=UPI00203CB392|nr:GNAT family N-acetyltransferase [Paenibacillus glycanilyticus]MCM3627112.1 GNAT family N-acetyltransferase [Paenibacillus glycanilyticus]